MKIKKRVSQILVFALVLTTLMSGFAFAAPTADMVRADEITIKANGHIQSYGDKTTEGKGAVSIGTEGESKRIEALGLELVGAPADMRIRYKAHVQTYGDSKDWIYGPATVGTKGESKRLEGIQIELVDAKGEKYPGYSVKYRVHMQSFGWGKDNKDCALYGKADSWAADGEFAGSKGFAKRLEAIEVEIIRENALKATVSAIGAKKLEVKFNKAIDTTKAALTVKKGSISVNTDKVEFAADKMSAVITTTVNLTKGVYTVTVAGLTEEPVTATTAVEDVKVSNIIVNSTKAPRVGDMGADAKQAKVSYDVLNQYGEKMTGQTVNWTVSTGETMANSTGTITITAAGGMDFIPGSVVYLTGVHASSGTVVNTQVEIVLASKADTLTFKGVYDKSKAQLTNLPAGFADNRYVLLFEIKDQYGNKIEPNNFNDLVFTSNNPLFVSADLQATSDVTLDDVKYKAIALRPGSAVDKGGSVTIKAISLTTGANSIFEIQAEAIAEVRSFTMEAPDKIVAEGEEVQIPFTALDQYGNAVKEYDALNGKVTLTPAYDGTKGLKFMKQKDGSAKLLYVAPNNVATPQADYPAYLTSVIAGGNFSSLMINVKDEAKPVVVAGVDKDLITNVAIGGKFTLDKDNIIVKDQYGRDFDLEGKLAATKAEGTYNIVIAKKVSGDTKISLTGNGDTATIIADGTKIDVTGDAKGIAAITIKLQEGNGAAYVDIANSDYTLNVNVAEKKDFVSYEIGELKPMNDSAAVGYNQKVVVYGVKADGSKVVIPAAEYSVTTNNAKLTYASEKLASDGTIVGPDGKDVTVKVTVIVNAADSAVVLTKDVIVTKPALTVAKAEWKDGAKATVVDGDLEIAKVDATTTANLVDALKLKDQFGVAYPLTNHTVTITNVKDKATSDPIVLTGNGTAVVTITNAVAGDTFNMTIAVDGKAYTIKVVVVD